MLATEPVGGPGYYTQSNGEFLLVASRGRPAIEPAVWPPSVILAPRTRHSEKPAEARLTLMLPPRPFVLVPPLTAEVVQVVRKNLRLRCGRDLRVLGKQKLHPGRTAPWAANHEQDPGLRLGLHVIDA